MPPDTPARPEARTRSPGEAERLFGAFREASWTSRASLEEFAASAAGLAGEDLVRLLPSIDTGGPANVRARLRALELILKQRREPLLFAPLLRLAVASNEYRRRVLVPLVEANMDPSQAIRLCPLLRSPEEELRQLALRLLSGQKSPQVFAWLSTALPQDDWDSRIEALEVLARCGGSRSLPVMARVVQVASPPEQSFIVTILARSRGTTQRAAAALMTQLVCTTDDGDLLPLLVSGVVAIAIDVELDELLGTLLEQGQHPKLVALAQQVHAFHEDRRVQVCDRLYRFGNQQVRCAAIAALQGVCGGVALATLVNALSDEDEEVRTLARQAVVGVGRAEQVDITQVLLALLMSHDAGVRLSAVNIIHEVGVPVRSLWPRLMALLRDTDWWVRERVTRVLPDLAGTDLTCPLLDLLEDDSDVVRRYAVETLAKVGDRRALAPLLLHAQHDPDWWVRERALECAGVLGDASIVESVIAIGCSSAEMTFSAVRALGSICSLAGTHYVSAALDSDDSTIRVEAAEALARIGPEHAAGALQRHAADPDPRVREAVRAALAGLPGACPVLASQPTDSGMERLVSIMSQYGADELFLVSEAVPTLKALGQSHALDEAPLTSDQISTLVAPLLSDEHHSALARGEDLDASIQLPSGGRYRVHVCRQLRGWTVILRRIADRISTFEELQLPPVLAHLVEHHHGLVLVTGPGSSGKSSTLAAMVGAINTRESRHVITIEDPIEVVHANVRSRVTQREVGLHTRSATNAMKSALREDPDVIMVGDLHGTESVSLAMRAAETGHLVLAAMNSASSETAIDRLIHAFPAVQAEQVRATLAENLRGVIGQRLVPRSDGCARAAAVEVLLNNDAVSYLIRKGQTYQLGSAMLVHRDQGMQTLDWDLARLVREGSVRREDAIAVASVLSQFEAFLAGEEPTRDDSLIDQQHSRAS